MSEPLTSHEIEDVLSSIRRLVSEDLRPARAAMAAARADAPEEAEKLLLTPALRVVAAEPRAEVPAPVDEPLTVVVLDEAVPEVLDLQPGPAPAAPSPYAPSAFGPGEEQEETGFPDPLAAFAIAEELYDDAGLEDDDAQPESGLHAGEEDVLWAAPGEHDPAHDEEVLTSGVAAPQPHGHWTAQDVPGMDWGQEETDWNEPEPVPFIAHPRKPDLTADPLARAWADRAEAAVRAELDETIIAGVTPPPAAEAGESAAARSLFDGAEGEVDEEMLRDIVRDIIREELAGTLGERITRNVRKLVRVEINRALAAREFE